MLIIFTSEINQDVGVAVPVNDIQSIGSLESALAPVGTNIDTREVDAPQQDSSGVIIRTRYGLHYVPGGDLKKCVDLWAKACAATMSPGDDVGREKQCCCGPEEVCEKCAGGGTGTSTIDVKAYIDDSTTTSTWDDSTTTNTWDDSTTTSTWTVDLHSADEDIQRQTELASSILKSNTEEDALRLAKSLLDREREIKK